jgi:hypothetical protein
MSKENKNLNEAENSALNIADVRRSSSSNEPDYRTEKGEWLVWNMLEYGNSIEDACKLLRQKEIVGEF